MTEGREAVKADARPGPDTLTLSFWIRALPVRMRPRSIATVMRMLATISGASQSVIAAVKLHPPPSPPP